MLIQIIKSNRGGNIAVHNGYCYNQKQVTSSCIHWRCTKYYSIKCPAVLKTTQNVVISLKDSHTHESDPSECKAKEVVNQIEQKSESLTPTVAIASEISPTIMQSSFHCRKKENLIRTACRKRQRENGIDAPTPMDRHFDIPEEFKTFLLKDSGKDDSERILMFGDTTMKLKA